MKTKYFLKLFAAIQITEKHKIPQDLVLGFSCSGYLFVLVFKTILTITLALIKGDTFQNIDWSVLIIHFFLILNKILVKSQNPVLPHGDILPVVVSETTPNQSVSVFFSKTNCAALFKNKSFSLKTATICFSQCKSI